MPKPLTGMFRRAGRPSWYGRLYLHGKDHWFCLGRDYGEARRKWCRILASPPGGQCGSVEEAVYRWLEDGMERRANLRDVKLIRNRAERYLIPFFGSMKLERVNRSDLRRFKLWLRDRERVRPPRDPRQSRKISTGTQAHILANARQFFRWCADADLIPAAPVPLFFVPTVPRRKPDPLTEEEVNAVCSLPDPHGFACRLLLATGLRWGDLVRLEASNLRGDVLEVEVGKTKNLVSIPVPAELAVEIRGHVGRLVPFLDPSDFNRMVRRRSGVDGFSTRRMRKTFSCRFEDAGGRREVLRQLLGHGSVVTTERYAQVSPRVVVEEARRVLCSQARIQ